MADVSKLASTRSDAARLALARLGAEARMLETREQLLDEWAQRSGRQPDPEVMADMVQRYNLILDAGVLISVERAEDRAQDFIAAATSKRTLLRVTEPVLGHHPMSSMPTWWS